MPNNANWTLVLGMASRRNINIVEDPNGLGRREFANNTAVWEGLGAG